MKQLNNNIKGVWLIILALFILSLQDIAVKWISGVYPVLEIVVFRSIIALPATLLIFRLEGNKGLPKTARPGSELGRGILLFLSYTTHYMGLAALPLAMVTSIRFSAPIMITALSAVLLGETVVLRRWIAVIAGFAGVLIIMRPDSAAFNIGSIFIVIAALLYALSVIITRKLRDKDSSATMAWYSTLAYLLSALIVVPVTLMIGQIPDAHPSIGFLFNSWTMPELKDLAIMSALGLIWAGAVYLLTRAYTLAPASVAAPFEYAALPISITWGFLIWNEVPALTTLAGALLTIMCGIYVLYRE